MSLFRLEITITVCVVIVMGSDTNKIKRQLKMNWDLK